MGVLGVVWISKCGLGILIRAPEVPFLVPPKRQKWAAFRDANHPQNPHLDTLGTFFGPRKVVLGHFVNFEPGTALCTYGVRSWQKYFSFLNIYFQYKFIFEIRLQYVMHCITWTINFLHDYQIAISIGCMD